MSSQRPSASCPIEARPQKTSDSNRSFARVESKTACAGADICSTSKPSLMISRMSRFLGEGLAVTKLPQTKIRRSRPPVAASSRMLRNRPDSHRRLGDEHPKRDMNSRQLARCTPGGSSPSMVSSGSNPNDSVPIVPRPPISYLNARREGGIRIPLRSWGDIPSTDFESGRCRTVPDPGAPHSFHGDILPRTCPARRRKSRTPTSSHSLRLEAKQHYFRSLITALGVRRGGATALV